MTSGGDAEQRIRAIESFAEHAYRNSGGDMREAVRSALRAAWREATEAAAKKCEAVADENAGNTEYAKGAMDAALVCIAAIRGES